MDDRFSTLRQKMFWGYAKECGLTIDFSSGMML